MKMRKGKSGPSATPSKEAKVMPASCGSPEQSSDSPGQTSQSELEVASGSGAETDVVPPVEDSEGESSCKNTGSQASLQQMLAELYRLVRDTHEVSTQVDLSVFRLVLMPLSHFLVVAVIPIVTPWKLYLA